MKSYRLINLCRCVTDLTYKVLLRNEYLIILEYHYNMAIHIYESSPPKAINFHKLWIYVATKSIILEFENINHD